MIKTDLTEKEHDFIITLRNYRRNRVNGKNLKFSLDMMYAELQDPDADDEV